MSRRPSRPSEEFWQLKYKGHRIYYMAHKRLINVTHVIGIYFERHKLHWALKNLDNIQKEIVKGNPAIQETYTSFTDAHRILRHLSIKSGVVNNLAQQAHKCFDVVALRLSFCQTAPGPHSSLRHLFAARFAAECST